MRATNTMLKPPMHPGKQVKCLGVRTTITRHTAASNCRKENTVFPRKNKTAEPDKSMHAGNKAISA
jgi:hypothetical protein